MVDFDSADFIFVTGLYDDENENDESYLPLLQEAKKRNLKLLCANPDIWVQRGKDLIPCAGAISQKYCTEASALHGLRQQPIRSS